MASDRDTNPDIDPDPTTDYELDPTTDIDSAQPTENDTAATSPSSTTQSDSDSSLLPAVVKSALPTPTDRNNTDDHPLPEPIQPRPYIEIRPAETPLDPFAVEHAMEQLEGLLRSATETGYLAKLKRSTKQPRVEWLLIADGRDDPTIRYLVRPTDPDLMGDVEGILRTAFPNTYEFRLIEYHPTYVEEHLPAQIPTRSPPPHPSEGAGQHHPAITPDHPYVAGVEYLGRAEHKRDWQTPLATYAELVGATSQSTTQTHTATHSTGRAARPHRDTDARRAPLASLIEAMSDADVPVIYQVVCRPMRNWADDSERYTQALETGVVSHGDRLWEIISPRSREERQRYRPPAADRARIDGITSRDPRQTLCISARAVALTRDNPREADAVARRLTNVFHHLSGDTHTIVGHVRTDDELHAGVTEPPGSQIYRDLCTRTAYRESYASYRTKWHRKKNESSGIVVSPAELAGLCLIDGAGLTPTGRRALATRPADQTGITLPPPRQLARYQPPGMALCMPLTHDRLPYDRPLYLPVPYQDRHVIVAGDTGAGKSVLLETAMLTNASATDGPHVLFDTKGGGTAEEYLRAHYAQYGDLDDVVYFDLSHTLPAISFFDIEALLAAGIPREEARSRKAGQYEELLAGVMGPERYGQAAESVKAIRNHLRACFDPLHGADAFSHTDLETALRRTHEQEAPPTVSEDRLEAYFSGLLERDRDVFNQITGGAIGRVETISNDGRLAPLFDHVHTDDSPAFDFSQFLSGEAVIVFDFGGMETEIKRTLTLAILSNLWSALRARSGGAPETSDTTDATDANRTHPQVTLYLEEAQDVASTQLVDTLLSQGRSFGLALVLGVQYPEQLDSPDPDNDTYQEALNETATVLSGKVGIDEGLVQLLATEEMPRQEIDHRLNTMARGEWLVRPGTDFGEPTPKPFLARSLPAPPGHPASDAPLTGDEESRFSRALQAAKNRTESNFGISQEEPATVDREAASESSDSEDGNSNKFSPRRIDSLLPHTKRLPECVTYDESVHALLCLRCRNRYDATIEGMQRAIACCHTIEDVEPEDIPVCDSLLKRSPEEIAESEWSLKQLLFLQAVYNAQQRRYHPLEYDITTTSMLRLQEYVGIDDEAIDELVEADLLRHDTDHPHRLYSVTPDGRPVIGEAYREGVDYGHGKGDLEESAEHVLGVAVSEQYLLEEYIENPESDAVELSPYHEIDVDGEMHRLDVAALDEQGEVVVAVEVERINHDFREAVPEDFDKMAACDLEDAIWVVMKQADGHKVLSALNGTFGGKPRVEKTYAETTPPQQFRIDTPGLTAIYPVEYMRDTLLDA